MHVTYSFSLAEIGDQNLLPAVPCIPDSNCPLLGFFNKALFRFGNVKHCCLISPYLSRPPTVSEQPPLTALTTLLSRAPDPLASPTFSSFSGKTEN